MCGAADCTRALTTTSGHWRNLDGRDNRNAIKNLLRILINLIYIHG